MVYVRVEHLNISPILISLSAKKIQEFLPWAKHHIYFLKIVILSITPTHSSFYYAYQIQKNVSSYFKIKNLFKYIHLKIRKKNLKLSCINYSCSDLLQSKNQLSFIFFSDLKLQRLDQTISNYSTFFKNQITLYKSWQN